MSELGSSRKFELIAGGSWTDATTGCGAEAGGAFSAGVAGSTSATAAGGRQERRGVACARFGRRSGAEFQERVQGAGELTVVGGFVALGEIEDAAVVGQVLESCGGALGGGCRSGLARHFQIEPGFLDSEDAEMAPADDGHGVDQGVLGGSARLEFSDGGGVELLEAVLRFAFEDDSLSQETRGGCRFRKRWPYLLR